MTKWGHICEAPTPHFYGERRLWFDAMRHIEAGLRERGIIND